MKVQTERLPDSLARLQIELDPDLVRQEMDRAYKRLANRVRVPGFRPGKAPRVLVERTLGEGALLQEATKDMVPNAIAEAVEQENLQAIGEPESFNVLDEDPYRFEITIPLRPIVTLGDYRSVHVEREPVTVSDDEVVEVIERLREREAVWVTPDPPRPAREGDQLVLDIREFVEGESVGEQEDVTVILGQGMLLPDLDRQLVGVEEGNEYEFEVALPEEYNVEEFAGKQAQFKIHVHSIKEKHLPELDDAFAARVGKDVSSLEDMRRRVREDLVGRAESQERERLLGEVISQVVATSQVEFPEVLVEHEIDHQIEHLGEELGRSRISLDQYLAAIGQSREELRESRREAARESVKQRYVLTEVAKAENITVEDADIERNINRITEGMAEDAVAEAREVLTTEEWQQRMRSDIYDRKLTSRLVEIATGEPLFPDAGDGPGTEAEGEAPEPVAEVEEESAAKAEIEDAPDQAAAPNAGQEATQNAGG